MPALGKTRQIVPHRCAALENGLLLSIKADKNLTEAVRFM
jgi:hypothetical protein